METKLVSLDVNYLEGNMYIGDKDDNATERFLLGLEPSKGGEQLIIFGINPSTATPMADDPTMRKIKNFVKRNFIGDIKFDGFLMFNVCAQRTKNPKDLIKNDNLHEMNKEKIRNYLKDRKDIHVWLAFGDNIDSQGGWLFDYFEEIAKLLKEYKPSYIHLGEFTAKGNPRHPLYVPDGTSFEEFTKENSPSKWDFLF